MAMVAETKEDKRWRAESDARTLAAAEEIKRDKVRVRAAMKEALRLAQEVSKQAADLKKVGGK